MRGAVRAESRLLVLLLPIAASNRIRTPRSTSARPVLMRGRPADDIAKRREKGH